MKKTKTKKELNPTVKGICALAMGCAAMALELASVVISIPAKAAGWCAHKLIDGANKLVGVEYVAHVVNKDEWDEFFKDENELTPTDAE